MNLQEKKESEKRVKLFLLINTATIAVNFTVIIGFFIFIYFVLSRV